MRTVLAILKRDLVALIKNPIALLVVGALLVLPGLYAWYSIFANWDPYSNTGSMPIAVVNEDEGATSDIAGDVNIGKQVVEKLQANTKVKWEFYDSKKQALESTMRSETYATIVLPSDLSENVVGILSGSEKEPRVYYYPNEKYSAIAMKVTDSAAQTLVREVNQTFSATVNKKVLSSAQSLTQGIEERAQSVDGSVLAELKDTRSDIQTMSASLDDALKAIAGWRDAARGASSSLEAVSGQLPIIREQLDVSSSQLDELRTKTTDYQGRLSSTILKSASSISSMSTGAVERISQSAASLTTLKSQLEALSTQLPDDSYLEGISDAIALVDEAMVKVNGSATEIDASVQTMVDKTEAATVEMSEEVMPQLNGGTYKLAVSFSRLSGAIGLFDPQIASLRDVLSRTDGALSSAVDSVTDAKELLASIDGNLEGLITDIGAMGSALELNGLEKLLNADPDNVGSFISMPVQMVTEKVYPVSNYGTAVSPFYTNLALWIGCFILVSLLKVEVVGFPQATRRQRYFGRGLLFVILSLLQSQIICGVDILLGIDCANPALFMLAGAVCSFAYMNLIYALVKTFRNIGKTLCIFLLIMQVPGSSGMYPIQMMPGFFRTINPMLPFTYGIDAMREALCGMYGATYVVDVLVLLLIIPGALLIGLGLRPVMGNILLMFDDEMGKTGFFASEEYVKNSESMRLRRIVRAVAGHDAYSDEIEERAWRFNRSYPRLRKLGTMATFVVPFAFLAVMLPINTFVDLSIDVKLTALLVMLVLLLVVMLFLSTLEYMNRVIKEESRLLGESLLGEEFGADLLADLRASSKGGASALVSGGVVSGKRGGPAMDIFRTDMKLGFQSIVGVVVIVLLVVTPAMYAWFNISGSWDPYKSTGNLKVAVVNEDEGYKGDLLPMSLNIGDTAVSQLRANASFDWKFVDRETAIAGVESGEYYAAIEVPKGFSSSMMTYLIGEAEYPQVLYYTNQKKNPIAPIITQKGAASIQENIRVSFTEGVDKVVLGVANSVLSYLKSPETSGYVSKLSDHVDAAVGDAQTAGRQIRSLSSLVGTVSSIVDATGSVLDGMGEAGDAAKSALKESKEGAADSLAAFDRAYTIAVDALSGQSISAEEIKAISDGAFDALSAGAGKIPGSIETLSDLVDLIKDAQANLTPEQEALFNAVSDTLAGMKTDAEAVPAKIEENKKTTDGIIDDVHVAAEDTKAYVGDELNPSVAVLRSTLSTALASTGEVVSGLEVAVEGFGDSTEGLSGQLSTLSAQLEKAGGKIEQSATNIKEMKTRISDVLSSGDVQKIEDVILGSDAETLAASLAAPVKLSKEPMYSVANYGSSMAPFYTVLSLWVGALVMISTMRTRVAQERVEELRRRYRKVKPRHEFLGRYGIFGFIGLLQSALVLLGDLMLLHIQCENPVVFVLAGLFIGQVFCLMVYTITELFGDVGKALCVILLVMQVAASGGTFPPEMLNGMLFDIVPYLPFHHAMTMLQECVAGIYWPKFLVGVAALLAFEAIALVAAIPLRRPFRKVNDFFEHQLEKTGYM